MGIIDDVMREILEAEKKGSSTARTAKDLVRLMLRHLRARVLVEIDSAQFGVTTMDTGSYASLDAYRQTIARAKDRLETFLKNLERETEEA